MRHLPTHEYSGLTIVLANPSRQDTPALLSGDAGVFFNQECLAPETSRWRCDIRTSDTKAAGLLPNTKAILLLGERALNEWATGYSTYSISEQRGNPLKNEYNLPMICSYTAQDSVDPINFEAKYNPHLQGHDDEDEEGGADEYEEKKRHGKTARSNYRFWLKRDTKKIIWFLSNKPTQASYGVKIYPQGSEVVDTLLSSRDRELYLDIETDIEHNMLCFGFHIGGTDTVYTVPILRHDYTLAYDRTTYSIIRALCLAINRNILVLHNSLFDLFVLAWKYKMPFSKHIYDTMLAQHRCFPLAEKSLGHSLSCWPTIWEHFHKDEGVFMPANSEQEKQLWNYNAKDVYAMVLVKKAQLDFAAANPGLKASIEFANKQVRPFLISTMQGILFDDAERQILIKKNDVLMTHYLRALNYLTGDGVDLLPTSSKSCVRYFHEMLGYPVVGRSKKTGEASLSEMNLLKLKMKNPFNAAIDFCIKYRQTKKETGMIQFEPWISK